MSLRADLYDKIEELKWNLQLMEAGVAFAGNVAALGGFASLNRPGGLFERVPRKQTKTRTDKPPVPSSRKMGPKKPPKPTAVTESEETQSTPVSRTEEEETQSTVVSRTEDDPTGPKGEKERRPAEKIEKEPKEKPGPRAEEIGKEPKEPTEKPSSKVGGKKGGETEGLKSGKMTETPWEGQEKSLQARWIMFSRATSMGAIILRCGGRTRT